MEKVIITAIDDNPKYIDYLKVMLVSFRENAPKEHLKVYLLGYKKKLDINPNAEIISYREVLGREEASHIRGELLLDLLKKGYKKLAWFDSDIIIRGKLNEFWEDIKPSTLKITYRAWQDVDKRKFQNGIYGIGNSLQMIELFEKFKRKMDKHKTEWYVDQLYLYKLWRKRKDIRLINLDRKWNDNHFEDDSIIWHCHMKKKDSSVKFNAEFEKYMELL